MPAQTTVESLLADALTAAPALLGWRLVHESPEGTTIGMIVETEAYRSDDPASHTFRGPGKRNAVMFGPAGHAYVYFTYGMHYCFNVVTGQPGQGQGVLIRALEPLEGIPLMRRRRQREALLELTNGPAKLVQAMGITKTDNGHSVLKGNLRLEPGVPPKAIVQTTRIGISRAVDQPWRFFIKDNPFVSHT